MNTATEARPPTEARLFVDARSAMAPCYPRYAVVTANAVLLAALNEIQETLARIGGNHVAIQYPVEWGRQYIASVDSELCVGARHFFFRGFSSDDRHIETAPVNAAAFSFALGRGEHELYFDALSAESVHEQQLVKAYEDAVEFEN